MSKKKTALVPVPNSRAHDVYGTIIRYNRILASIIHVNANELNTADWTQQTFEHMNDKSGLTNTRVPRRENSYLSFSERNLSWDSKEVVWGKVTIYV